MSNMFEYRFDVNSWEEYKLAKQILTPIRAKRTGENHFTHVEEGIRILTAIGASDVTKKAFALHPLVQKEEDFLANFMLLGNCNQYALMLAVEYRWVANNGTRRNLGNGPVVLSGLKEVNQMLIADKVQNRMSFRRNFKPTDPDYADLEAYFEKWLVALGIDDAEYERLVEAGVAACESHEGSFV